MWRLAIAHGCHVQTWELDNESRTKPPKEQELISHHEPITNLCWDHKGEVLAVCCRRGTHDGDDNNVLLLDTATTDILHNDVIWGFHHGKGDPSCLALGGKSRYLAIADNTGSVHLWDLKKKQRVRSYRGAANDTSHEQRAILQTSIVNDSLVYALSAQELTAYWLRSGKLAFSLDAGASSSMDHDDQQQQHYIRYQVISLELVALATRDGMVELWNVANDTTQPLHHLSLDGGVVCDMALLRVETNRPVLMLGTVERRVYFSIIQKPNKSAEWNDGVHGVSTTTTPDVVETTLVSNLTALAVLTPYWVVGDDEGTILVYCMATDETSSSGLRHELLWRRNVAQSISALCFAPKTTAPTTASVPTTDANNSIIRTNNSSSFVQKSTPIGSPVGQSMNALSAMVDQVLNDTTTDPPSEENGRHHNVSAANNNNNNNHSNTNGTTQSEDNNHSRNTINNDAILLQQQNQIQHLVDTAMDGLRDDVLASVRNLHVDMLNQFQLLQQEQQQVSMQQRRLEQDNETLRAENERLTLAVQQFQQRKDEEKRQ